jgi:hypothetical protein
MHATLAPPTSSKLAEGEGVKLAKSQKIEESKKKPILKPAEVTTLEFNVKHFPAQYRAQAKKVIDEMNKFAINNFNEGVDVLENKFGEVALALGEQGVIQTKHVFVEAVHWLLLDR